jgi:hypothetical protein
MPQRLITMLIWLIIPILVIVVLILAEQGEGVSTTQLVTPIPTLYLAK